MLKFANPMRDSARSSRDTDDDRISARLSAAAALSRRSGGSARGSGLSDTLLIGQTDPSPSDHFVLPCDNGAAGVPVKQTSREHAAAAPSCSSARPASNVADAAPVPATEPHQARVHDVEDAAAPVKNCVGKPASSDKVQHPRENVESTKRKKKGGGMTLPAKGGALNGSKVGLLDFWTDVSVMFVWWAGGDDMWFEAGMASLGAVGFFSGFALWLRQVRGANLWSEDSKSMREIKKLAALPMCLFISLFGFAPTVARHLSRGTMKAEAYRMFKKIDGDHSGFLSRDELCELCNQLRGGNTVMTDLELDAAMSVMDDDESGTIQFVEFWTWWEKSNPKHMAQQPDYLNFSMGAAERDMETLKYLAFIELFIKTLPQSVLQAYVGVSYGQFTFDNPNFSWLLVLSVATGLFSGGKGIVGARGMFGGDAVSLKSLHGACLLIGRVGQLGSTVFSFALLGCGYKLTDGFVEAAICMTIYLMYLWVREPAERNLEDGPLKPLKMNLLHSLAICGLLSWFFAGEHTDNNYADRSRSTWLYTYTNSSTAEAKVMGFSPDDIEPYSFLRSSSATGEVVWAEDLRIKEFATWPELTTGGSFDSGRILEPLVPGDGTWSAPFSYDCHERINGIYSTYVTLLMGVVGMTAAIYHDPLCGNTKAAKECREKVEAKQKKLEFKRNINKESRWRLVTDGNQEYYYRRGTKPRIYATEMPNEGVKRVEAKVGEAFNKSYEKAKVYSIGNCQFAAGQMPPESSMRAMEVATYFAEDSISNMENLMLGQSENGRVMRTGKELVQAAPGKLMSGGWKSVLTHFRFWVTVATGILNVYSITSRFRSQPERDASVDYNLSELTLAWAEMGYMVFLLFSGGILPIFLLMVDGSRQGRATAAMDLADFANESSAFSMFSILGSVKSFFPNMIMPQIRALRRDGGCSKILQNKKRAFKLVVLVGVFIPLVVVSPLCVLVKLSQVSFVGKPPASWSFDHRVQFVAFVNNLLGMDHSKDAEKRMLDSLLFFGEDAEEDEDETQAKQQFHELITAYMIEKLGFYKAVVARSRLDASKMQSMLIKDDLRARRQTEVEKSKGLNKASKWVLYINVHTEDQREYYYRQVPGKIDEYDRYRLEMPNKGVKSVELKVGVKGDEKSFDDGYAMATIASQVKARRHDVEKSDRVNEKSEWSLWVNAKRECYVQRNSEPTKRVYSLKMPPDGVSKVHGEVGEAFNLGYARAELEPVRMARLQKLKESHKLKDDSDWILRTNGKQEYFYCKASDTHEVKFSVEMPEKGVKNVNVQVGTRFEEGYARAAARKSTTRLQELEKSGIINKDSQWSLLTDGEREVYSRRNAVEALRLYTLEMPREGVSAVSALAGKVFEQRYQKAQGQRIASIAQTSMLQRRMLTSTLVRHELQTSGKISKDSAWTLYNNGEKQYYRRQNSDTQELTYSLEMPQDGVNAVIAQGGEKFEDGYAMAKSIPQVAARQAVLVAAGKVNRDSEWTLLSDGEREYYHSQDEDLQHVYSLEMPDEGVKAVEAQVGPERYDFEACFAKAVARKAEARLQELEESDNLSEE